MARNTTNRLQAGFSVVEIVIVIVIVAILGLAGYVVLHRQQGTKTAKVSKSSHSSADKAPYVYLPITQWKVEVRIPAVTSPLYIMVGKNEAYLTSKGAQANPKCRDYYPADTPAFTFIVRALPTDPPVFTDNPGANPPKTVQSYIGAKGSTVNAAKVGQYYYYTAHQNGLPCDDAAMYTLEGIDNQPLTIKPIND